MDRAAPAPGQIDQLRALFQQTPSSLFGNLIGLALVPAIFLPLAAPATVLVWLAVGAALWLLRLAHYLRYRRARRARTLSDADLQRWRPSWTALVLLQAAVWGVAVWLFWGLGTSHHAMSLLLIVSAYCLASVQLLATQMVVFLAFLAVVLLPTLVRIASDSGQPWHWQLAGILCLLFAVMVVMARGYASALNQAIRLKLRTDELAAQLRVEAAAAQAARLAAEAASRAKTQFFAAASHDLRQPLHAMGLFAEALRQRTREPELAALVNGIHESVDALDGLFGELLDITRIDSGGVDVQPAPVPLQPLFARLRLHFEPLAFEKGLMLGFRGGHHIAQADPVLLERVLRNLVSNAIRYTEDGGVLVGCRPRAGALCLQVWDSGIGIAPEVLPHIFDEFYQVAGGRALQAHQRKGLGLGLAIVQRLAGLMGAPLAVRSRVGRGTVFTLTLPAGRAPRRLDPAPAPPSPALVLTLDGRRIVVVEDDAAVREGMVVLLQSWGATVQAFDDLPGLQRALAEGRLGEAAPDLALVDHRLPAGRTGVEALQALRAHWPGQRLPAIVVTGSTLGAAAGSHEDEATRHDYHLLLKPVLPNRLRALIGFKLGVRSQGG